MFKSEWHNAMGEVVVKLENRIQHWERVGCDDEGHIYDNDNLTFTGEWQSYRWMVVMMKGTFMIMIILQVNATMSEVVESEDSIQHWERVLALADLMLRWQWSEWWWRTMIIKMITVIVTIIRTTIINVITDRATILSSKWKRSLLCYTVKTDFCQSNPRLIRKQPWSEM